MISPDSDSLSGQNVIEKNINTISRIQRDAEVKRTFGEKIADSVAHSIGSWPFIIIQSTILAVWIILNACGLFKAWDPYPFILLNLALSFQAAYASPIIMMSQNRQAKLADERNHLALQIALLAEQEDTETLRLIRQLCEKLHIDTATITKELEEKTDAEAVHAKIRDAKKRP